MLLQPKFYLSEEKELHIAEDAQFFGDIAEVSLSLVKEKLKGCGKGSVICKRVEVIDRIPQEYLDRCEELSRKDAFVVEAGEVTKIYSFSIAGIMYGASLMASYGEELSVMTAFDYPNYEFRGYKIFVPARDKVESISELLDFISDYRCNTLMIELGGALEYKRHPEINSSWEEFCKDVGEYSGKGIKIANGAFFPWPKNVIHVDNGGRGFITQEQARFIKKECDKRGIKVVCEIPSLSHCDYLVKPYEEIRERIEDDQYPDSYCPSNPRTYEILFDIIDEAIEIFDPEYVNIGHDELFSIGLCERCKGKDPVELFVKDVEKINGYLKSKGVKTMMWADMLSNKLPKHGGAGRSVPGDPQYVPPLYEIRDRLPKDVIMINWWYYAEDTLSEEIEKRGYEMLFGNFGAYTIKNWTQFECKNLFGGFESNWGSLEPEYMQRNGQYFNLIYNSAKLWGNITEEQREEIADKTLEEGYRRAKSRVKDNCFEVLVTTDYYAPGRAFYDGNFIIDSEFILGNLVVTLKNGDVRKFCLKYGQNIGNCDLTRESFRGSRSTFTMAALPVELEGKAFYKCFWDVDFGADDVEKMEFEKIMDKEFNVEYRLA